MSELSQRPAIASAPISVILFAHALSTETNEAIHVWRDYLATLHRPYEVLLIQETRPEVTLGPADEILDAAKPTRTFTYERSLGLREALRDAIHVAQHPLLVFCTADKQYQPDDLKAMLERIDLVDMVVGFRAGGQAPPWRVLLDTAIGLFSRIVLGVPLEPRRCWFGGEGWGRRLIARWIFGVRVLDPECPFRLARRAMFKNLPIQSGGPFLPVEMLAKANHLTYYLWEEPVRWTPPVLQASDAITFGQDAWVVFRDPDFGAPTLPRPALAEETPTTSRDR